MAKRLKNDGDMIPMNKEDHLLVIPIGITAVILLYLVAWNVYISLTNWSLLNPVPKVTWLYSYYEAMKEAIFLESLAHSFELSITVVVAGDLLGILIAWLLYEIGSNTARSVFLSIFIYPLAIAMAVSAIIWMWLYNPTIGIDWLLAKVGLPQIPWLSAGWMVFPSVEIMSIWAYSGLAVIFFLAAFMGVDPSLVEAAKIDGAGSFKILRKVLLPNSLSGFVVATAMLFLFSFKEFSGPLIISGTPVATYTTTMVTYLYYLSTVEFFAESAAVSTIVIIIATAVIIPYALYIIRRFIRG